MARRCKKCNTIETNMSLFRCRVCNEVFPVESIEVDAMKDDTEDRNKWYIKCGSCGAWIAFEDKNDIPTSCPECYEVGINNVGEDSILSLEEYLLETNEMRDDVQVENDKVGKDYSAEDKIRTDEFTEKKDNNSERYIELINNGDRKVIRIDQGKHILGKLGDIESDYFSQKKYIGRQHAVVTVDDTGAFIEDWNSTNGTKINGEAIYKRQGKMRIVDEDIITMADQNFEVRICK